jgi:hypothetical protein
MDRRENEFSVRMIRRGNDHSLNVRTIDQLERIGVCPRIDCGFPGSGRIRICYGSQMCSRHVVADETGVIRPHHASANDSNSNAHLASSHIHLAG